MRKFLAGSYDVVVVGAGHAGCETALACARLGYATLLLTLNLDGLALMACNPAVGGTSKGHLVREVDALGGEMGLAIDDACLQTRMLNLSKGPAVHSLRAQADKKAYQARMRRAVDETPNLDLRQGECTRILTRSGAVWAVDTDQGLRWRCRAVVVATGVYLKSRIIIGEYTAKSGPSGFFGAEGGLSRALCGLGFSLLRFKTGTPARVDRMSLDFNEMEPQPGDPAVPPFSFMNDRVDCPQIPCHLTWTGAATHDIIRANLHRSPLFSGDISGTGPRYCPSIESKVVTFPDKARHQVFIEPEGRDSREMYVQGMSTSLPYDVQLAMLRTLPGLGRAQIMRPGYAIEYDCIDPTALDLSLMARDVGGLFFAGQINGSSGYEEAAAQGIVAGLNAAQYLRGEPPLILGRDQAYIGVLVDDLVTKGAPEPYRMMTSRAEYRLLLRQDNADERLTAAGRALGLVTDARYDRMARRAQAAARARKYFDDTKLPPSPELAALLTQRGGEAPDRSVSLAELLRRPGVKAADLLALAGDPGEPADAVALAATEVKYAGYIEKQARQVERMRRLEDKKLPPDFDYASLTGLRLEARQKLAARRPENVGQAGRISGVSPADVAVLLIALERRGRQP